MRMDMTVYRRAFSRCHSHCCFTDLISFHSLLFLIPRISQNVHEMMLSMRNWRKSTGPHIQLRVVTRKPNKGIIYRFINRCPYLAASHSRFSLLASVFLMVYNGSWMQK
eukprot:TRINITY_DN20788_c1_g1_i4.p1 TRINITY_DN20788_c1_g1~~TRINITY_DN20788_c1_g1_i4.p1  ORF type:complete len:109 (+),score=7.07 TRINITY_DN20788_c1_g1_i4:321-647(+)